MWRDSTSAVNANAWELHLKGRFPGIHSQKSSVGDHLLVAAKASHGKQLEHKIFENRVNI